MKYQIVIICLVFLMLTSCESKTEYGQCVGAFDEKKPDEVYKLSVQNLVVGIIFAELIVPPIVVIADATFCPVGEK